MAFKVEVTEPAERDIEEVVAYIAQDSPAAAAKWLTRLWEVIFSLREMPARFAVIPEAESLGLPYRSVLHYSHRVIYRIDEPSETVYTVRVYHGARKPLSFRDVAE